MIFKTLDPQFLKTWSLHSGFPIPKKTWEILGYGFQDMVFKTWDLNFGAWEILGYGFKDMVFRTWFSRLGISTLEPGFSHSRFPRPKPENF